MLIASIVFPAYVGVPQKGQRQTSHGEELRARLAVDLTCRFGRGFSAENLERFQRFYLCFLDHPICATVLRKFADSDETNQLCVTGAQPFVEPALRVDLTPGPSAKKMADRCLGRRGELFFLFVCVSLLHTDTRY